MVHYAIPPALARGESFARRRMRHRRPIPIIAVLLLLAVVASVAYGDDRSLVSQKYRQSYGVEPSKEYVDAYFAANLTFYQTRGSIPGRTLADIAKMAAKPRWPEGWQRPSGQTRPAPDFGDTATPAKPTAAADTPQDTSAPASPQPIANAWRVLEYDVLRLEDMSSRIRSRMRLTIEVPEAKSNEERMATAMQAALDTSAGNPGVKYFALFIEIAADKAPLLLGYATDGCGVSGSDCTGERWTDSSIPIPRSVERRIVEPAIATGGGVLYTVTINTGPRFPACPNPDGIGDLTLAARTNLTRTFSNLFAKYECFWLANGAVVQRIGDGVVSTDAGGGTMIPLFLVSPQGDSRQAWFPQGLLVRS